MVSSVSLPCPSGLRHSAGTRAAVVMTPHDTRYQTGLKTLFAFLRAFNENAVQIFGKFESFA
jgi:hypothetical protein